MPYINDTPPAEEDVVLEPIAICGMGCRLPGQVDSPSALWDLLLKKGSGSSAKVPKTRFNIDAHFHKDLERPGSFNVLGGYFLDGPAENFDPTFFSMTPIEAMWLDPQQRKILEVCYEAIEAAGLTLQSIAGSNTGVFVGSFTADYQQMSFRDPDFRHSYAATGVDPGIISNRVGNIFDLNGPSFTINTACSSSVYAIHHACHSLRAGDCDAALVGGVNLILTVDQHMNTAKLGVLSPTSFCHTFDAAADGYGRGEGAGAVYLKRLSDAIKDGDVIRAVIRSSAVNTNGKVPGYGITYPNVDGQERVIRAAYRKANLNPNRTAYFECHGTGTPVGDPIEVRAVSNAMNDSRSPEKPLLIGAIKPNIGHSEAASGVFALMKAAMMVEQGIIPGVAGLQTVNPEIPEATLNVKVNRDTIPWPQGFESRRASVSSFGYGGTNGHIIIEDIRALYPLYRHGARKGQASYDHSSTRPLLLTFSAHDKATLVRNIEAHTAVINQFYLADVAHTLNLKRSRFSHRGFVVAGEATAIDNMAVENFSFGSSNPISQLAFVFTGQGAAWAGMGRDAIQTFPVFRQTIQKLDLILKSVDHPPSFSIEEQLISWTSDINNANISQPTLVATEIALVDLLASWGIVPAATVGHSAGEYAAAYAAGLASAPELIIAAYYRGYCLEKYANTSGSMLAVGRGSDELNEYLPRLSKDIVIACENSPNSVTLSGTTAAIQDAKHIFTAENIFARELRTGMAYHSPQMEPVAAPMVGLVENAYRKLDTMSYEWRCPRVTMISSVTNCPLADGQINPEYWASNLTGRVLFNTAIKTLAKAEGFENLGAFIEIGPHSALAGPLKQIFQRNGLEKASYIPTLIRNEDGARSLLKTAGELFLRGYPVDLYEVNKQDTHANTVKRSEMMPLTLVDLPPYQWNYEKVFWAEPRMSAEYRQLTHARHDLLGSRMPGLSHNNMVWRNILRLKDIPWLQDHKLGGSIMFPAAGHMALAIEAARQHCEIKKIDVIGATLRNFELKTALIIPESDTGIEIQLRLLQCSSSGSAPCYSFAVESYLNNAWVTHSEGTVSPVIPETNLSILHHPVNLDRLTQRHTGERWNQAFRRVGFEYGPSFDSLEKIRTHEDLYQAAGQIPVTTASNLMVDESRYVLHPSTVDCLLQLSIISIHAGLYDEIPWGVVPIKFEEVTILSPGDDNAGAIGQAVAWNTVRGERSRYFNTNAQLATDAGRVVLDIKGLHTVAYEAALPPSSESRIKPLPYAGIVWKPDYTICGIDDALSEETKLGTAIDAVPEAVRMFNHKQALSSVLVVDLSSDFDVPTLMRSISLTGDLHVACGVPNPVVGTKAGVELLGESRVKRLTLPEGPVDWSALNLGAHDLVIVNYNESPSLVLSESLPFLESQITTTSKVICLFNHDSLPQARIDIQNSGFLTTEISFSDRELLFCTPKNGHTSGLEQGNKLISLVYSKIHSAAPHALADAMTKQHMNVQIKAIEDVDPNTDKDIVLYNPSGNLLSHPEPSSFEALKKIVSSGASVLFLTAGVNEAKCAHGAMLSGFLRVVRNEQKMSDLFLLDFDKNQTLESIAKTVIDVTAARYSTDSPPENEYWLHNGACYISRIVPNEDINSRMTPDETSYEMPLPRGKLLRATLAGGKAVFHQSDALERTPIKANEVEIQIENLDFHLQDLQTAAEGPRLVTGIVIDIGQAVDNSLLSKTVITYTHNLYDTIVRNPEILCVECSPNAAQRLLYSLPTLCQAANVLQSVPGPIDEKHILLLPSANSLAPSFATLSRAQGFKVTVVADGKVRSEEAVHDGPPIATPILDVAQIHRTMGDAGSALVVVAQDYSALTQEIWARIPAGAWLVLSESKQAHLSASPDVNPFNRGAHFCVTTIDSTLNADPSSMAKILCSVVTIIENDTNCSNTPQKVLNIGALDEASQIATDRSVLAYNYEGDIAKIFPAAFQLRFSPDDAYLLVGCLGGLGRSLTSWMISRGAKHFAFISRSADDKPEAAQLIKSIKEAGAIPQVFRGDASKPSDVSRVISAVTSERRIKGVVHAAMVLQDAILGPNMTTEKFKTALAPKVDGAQTLHHALKGHDLDFFVMTSSISATVGQPGQSNYAAANSFLDNLAWQRNLNGLPATSLILPMVLGVGVVAESDTLEDKIARTGMYGINEREMLRGFEAAMSQPVPSPGGDMTATRANSAINLGLDPTRLAAALAAANWNTDIEWTQDPRFSSLRPLIDAAAGGQGGNSTDGASGTCAEQAVSLAAEGEYDQAISIIATYIIEKCASILMKSAEDFELDGPSIGAYGLDSMIGAELRNWLFKQFGLNIAFQDLLATTLTFKGLSELVLGFFGVAKPE
ncbi:lovastatin nonaketide synthase [Nannizzia gypsea CBS 118893]|uniref:Non-reducing polyketide synthase nscA n=1 Tax=Arthroderma gypseum (strain ATCC MYA-4604 / CBS 118893) TaxID=535722 RepID=E4UP69_ARTGP|nr:lovastatin nonaketide synthase [Nannizzia gypsea CBS 118893]EFQ99795.1 lovastatin nonaketide synthase [Nannizzia gypsea CBS 118893]